PIWFGYTSEELGPGRAPALAQSTLDLTFVGPKGPDGKAVIPDLLQLFFAPTADQELQRIAFRAQADGPLRAAYGVPDNTPGRAQITQNGLIFAGSRNGFKGGLLDAFPAEHIDLQVVGR